MLEQNFIKFGDIEKVIIVREPFTKVSRGFGFVTYTDAVDALKALEEMNQIEIEGTRIQVEIAKRKDPRPNTPGKYMGMTKRSYQGGRDSDRYDRRRSYRDDYDRRGR